MSLPRLPVLARLLALLLLGCAAQAAVRPEAPSSPAPAAPAVPREDKDRDGMSLSGGLGQIDEAEVEEQFRAHLPAITDCYKEQLTRRWFLSGRVDLRLRIGKDGQVRTAAVTQSSLGSYEVERCVAQVAKAVRFQSLKGGEAELSYPVEFPARSPVRSWPTERVASQMARHRGALSECQRKAPQGRGPLRLTVYIGPGGRVAAAGLAADVPIDDRVGGCVVARALGWRFDDPLGELVKASYAFD